MVAWQLDASVTDSPVLLNRARQLGISENFNNKGRIFYYHTALKVVILLEMILELDD